MTLRERGFSLRTRGIGLKVIRLTANWPRDRATDVIARQLIRCSTSVGANHRAAFRARSTKEMIAKLGVAEEECDECLFWLLLSVEAGICDESIVAPIFVECEELLRMIVASVKSLRKKAGIVFIHDESQTK